MKREIIDTHIEEAQVSAGGRTQLENILCQYCRDSDSRVRASAALCLLDIAQNSTTDGWNLSFHCYHEVTSLLDDFSDSVRITALELIKFFSASHPEK